MDINLWNEIESEVRLRIDAEPTLGPFLNSLVLSQKDLLAAVASILASKLIAMLFLLQILKSLF